QCLDFLAKKGCPYPARRQDRPQPLQSSCVARAQGLCFNSPSGPAIGDLPGVCGPTSVSAALRRRRGEGGGCELGGGRWIGCSVRYWTGSFAPAISGSQRRPDRPSPSAMEPARKSPSAWSRAPRSGPSCSIPSCGWARPTWMAAWSSSEARSPTCSRLRCVSAATASRRPGRGRHGCSPIPRPPPESDRGPGRRRTDPPLIRARPRLYARFLDADRQYSCAYFETDDQSLDDAQLAKKRHLAAKLLLAPDQRVLDIGCGWGGLALYFAEHCGARVTGITLSQEQHALPPPRAEEKGLAGKVALRLEDYRDVPETFD